MKRRSALLMLIPLAMLGCQKTGELGGTSWNVVEVISLDEPDMEDMEITFGAEGWLHATIYHVDGSIEESRRQYYVYRSLLVVERPNKGDLELLYSMNDGELVLTDEDFQARLRPVN